MDKVAYWLDIADYEYELMNEEQRSFLDAMTPMNIEARYPDYKSLLASSLNQDV